MSKKGILHICPKVVYTFGDCEKSPFFFISCKISFQNRVLQIAKKTAKFPLPESVNYQMKDAKQNIKNHEV